MLFPKFKAVISDIDGTLTPIAPNAFPSEKVTQTIKKAIKQGLTFSLASGRPYYLVGYLIDHLGDIGPCIVDNGAVIVDSKNGSVLWEAILSHDSANRILELSKKFTLVRASLDTGGLENPNKISKQMKVRKISIHDIPMEQGEAIISQITAEFHDVTGVKAASYADDHLIDVYFSDINATKQQAVLQLSEILEVATDDMIGVGDGYNDFSMLMACGLKVAMGNAVDDLKAIADVVAPSVEHDGLAYVIEKYCLG